MPHELVGPTFRLVVPATLVLLAIAAFGYLPIGPAILAWLAALGVSVGVAWLRQRELKETSAYINALIDGHVRDPLPDELSGGTMENALRRLHHWMIAKEKQDSAAPAIIGCLDFPPELCQAGISILQYFATIVKQKYPETSVWDTDRATG